ncbi:MAG: EAL domain-containing protein [Humidesulfovibrio sp.]|nr:EAL domain-containing protein [Humidesulfovibrio sp.]
MPLFLMLVLAVLCLGRQRVALAQDAAPHLTLACPDDIPPYCFRDANGHAVGLLPDFWRLFAKKTGIRVELRAVSGAEALLLLETGEVDAHAGLALDFEQSGGSAAGPGERFEFSRPLFDQGLGLFSSAAQAAYLGQTPGRVLGKSELTAGLVGGDQAASFLAISLPNLRQRVYPDLDALAAGLALGQVNVAAGPVLPLRYRLRALGGPKRFALLRSYPGTVLRAMVRKGDQALLGRINTGLESISPDEVKNLMARYSVEDAGPPAWLPGVFFGVLCLAISLAVLRRARLVRRRTEARGHEMDLLRDNLLAEMARHRKTQDLLLSAIEQSPSGILIAYADRDAPPVLNSHALNILGLETPPPPGKLPDSSSWRVYTSQGKLLSKPELPLAMALRMGETMVNAELRVVLADGVERWILTNAAPVRDSQGNVRAGVVVFHDITASRRAERELARFKFFLEAGVEEVYLLQPNGLLSYVNEAVARSLGHARQELLGIPVSDIAPSMTPEAVGRLLHSVRHAPVTLETVQRTRDGRPVLKELKVFYMRFGDEEYVCGFGRDITEQSRLARELGSTRALFGASLEQAPWGIIIGDAATGRVSIANQAGADLLGVTPEQLVGMDINGHHSIWTFLDAKGEVVTPDETPLRRAILHGEDTRDLEVRFILEGGPERWLLANASPVRGADGEIVAGIMVMADITARKRMENQLVFKALHDALTGLPNRDLCLESLQLALEQARERGGTFAVAFVDLDRFKMLNDSLGHSFGDRVLLETARRLLRGLGGQGQVCRFGGDEFVLLVDRAESVEAAQAAIRAALDDLSRPMSVDGQEVRLTASVGVVLGPSEDGPAAENILQNADLAMHRAKDAGRDRVRLFHPGMLRRAQELMALDADMCRGLERDEFLVFYQPIMSSRGGEILGFEALARWRSPSRGLVSPHAFIAHAEDSGLIIPLGEQVLRKACAGMTAWRRRFPAARRMTLAVNLSARQFIQPDIVDTVRQVLRETGLPPALLKLELTESTLMGDPETALSSMRRLKALGVSLAIDDFGTGYSSLAYLQRFPVDILKIDRSFVRDLPRKDADSRALVGAIAALADSLRLGVVAEGVETAEQLAMLVELGCEAVQGFLFYPPLPEDAVIELLLEAEERVAQGGLP